MVVHTFHRRSSLRHFNALHSPFFISLHCWTFRHHASKTLRFYSLIITFLPLFLKICNLQGKVANASAGGWFHSLIVLFTKEYLPIWSYERNSALIWKNGFAIAFTYCNKEVRREQALAYLNALPGALDVWSMKVTVFCNMTQRGLIMCTEISEEFSASIVTIDESFPDAGDEHCLNKSYTFLQGLLCCIISESKSKFH